MNKNILLFVLYICVFNSFSQEKPTKSNINFKQQADSINEGYIVLKIYRNSLEADTLNSVTYFKNGKMRAQSPYDSINGQTICISDDKRAESLTLMNHPISGKQYEFIKSPLTKNERDKIEVIMGNKKREILDYNCQQYVIKINESTYVEAYTTEEIFSSWDNNDSGLFGGSIKGFVLSYTIIQENFNVKTD